MKLKCTFIPQAWQNDYAIEVDPEGETQWEVTLLEMVELTDYTDPDKLKEDDYARDELRHTKEAPQWVRDWAGPFEVKFEMIGYR